MNSERSEEESERVESHDSCPADRGSTEVSEAIWGVLLESMGA
jgi:hypothetical protein